MKPTPKKTTRQAHASSHAHAPPHAHGPSHVRAQQTAPGKHKIRLVAIDLDGTLLNDSKLVSDQTLHALACAATDGVRIVIASARPPRSVRHIYSQLKLDTLQINYNGALIWDEGARKVLFHRPIDGELARRMIRFARGWFDEVLVTCEVLDKWYTDRDDQTFTTETGKLFKPDVISPVESFCQSPITKLMFLGQPKLMDTLLPMLEEEYGKHVSLVKADDDLIQVMDKRVSKATALRKVAHHYGIPISQVMAIGDAPNDVAMLQVAGVGVAMDNAHRLVKAVADWVAPSNNDHGVHAALKRYGLCK
jgi:5-amino-6-(5-phospho-D-ribitylamino)uracil phosphatase